MITKRRNKTGYNNIIGLKAIVYGTAAGVVLGCLLVVVVALW